MPYKYIGKQIQKRRKGKGLTQQELSETADISLSFLGHIERGTRKLSIETLLKLLQALDCSADELLGTGKKNQQIQISAREILQQAMLLAEKAE